MSIEAAVAASLIPPLPILFRRNRPIRSHSRWRKTLARKNRGARIIEADRRNPFMKIEYCPKSAEEREEIEERLMMLHLAMGTIAGPSMLLGRVPDPESTEM